MTKSILDLEPNRRNTILNAALKEFTSKGFDKASTNIIAKEAGISKALMFHYINNKKDLFLYTYEYFNELLYKEYYMKIDFTEKDILKRLYQSYILQIKLLKQHPYILDFNKLSTLTSSDEINERLKKFLNHHRSSYCNSLFDMIDESKFRPDLNITKCKQFILWANIGFTNEILDNIRNSESKALNDKAIIKKLDEYFDELKKVFYVSRKGDN